ncbi:MAG TPA: HAD family hydrolase [Candidatus Saccharimonadales bacterium]|nr:HAD family hydrolase [Candidatus Saccharimonadales bacterium]
MKAIVFDLDGTLLDVRQGFYWQFQELTRIYDGAPIAREMINASAHGTTEQIVRSLVRNTKVPFDEILRTHQDIRLQSYDRFLRLYDGVDELLSILKRMDMRVAALTSGNNLTVGCLDRTNIRHHFDSIVTAEKVENPKPHPEGLHLIINELGITPEDVVVVGDTAVDILVGKNAGVGKTIGISHGFGNVDALFAAGADHVVHNVPSILDVIE